MFSGSEDEAEAEDEDEPSQMDDIFIGDPVVRFLLEQGAEIDKQVNKHEKTRNDMEG